MNPLFIFFSFPELFDPSHKMAVIRKMKNMPSEWEDILKSYEETVEAHKNDIKHLEEWHSKQPHLPQLTSKCAKHIHIKNLKKEKIRLPFMGQLNVKMAALRGKTGKTRFAVYAEGREGL